MIRFDQAQDILSRQAFSPMEEQVPLKESMGRILSEDLLSPIDVPPFSKSAMDGYAIVDGKAGDSFRIVEVLAAGVVPERAITAGECAKIMTGAMVPEGTGRVVKKESALEEDGIMSITKEDPKKNILYRGEDITAGQTVLMRGTRLRPSEIAFLASIGIASIPVYRRAIVGVIITGSELVEPGHPLTPGKIYNSNQYSIASQIEATGALLGPCMSVADNAGQIEAAIRSVMEQSDLVILSGGVSEGDYDFVPAALQRTGIRLYFEKVAVQPGKPTIFGRKDDKVFFGLPGNPVSAFLIFEVFIKQLLFRIMGHTFLPLIVPGTLQEPIKRKSPGRTQFLPAEFKNGLVYPLPYHGSAHLHALTRANAIMTIPEDAATITAGQTVHVRLL